MTTPAPTILPNHQGVTIRIGRTGLKLASGRIAEEYHALLRSWQREANWYLEMRDAAVVGTALRAVKLPLLSAEFDVEPGAEGAANGRAAEWLWRTMTEMRRQTWRQHVSDMLEAIDFGFAVSEIVLAKRPDGLLWLEGLEPRGQETLEQWRFAESDDRATHFVQRDPNTGDTFDIPLARCLHFTIDARKANPQGRSLLRSAWRPWRFLQDLENLEGIGVERDVGGMPIARLPRERLESEDTTTLENALKALRQDENLYLMLDNETELIPYAGGSKQYDIGAIIDRKKKEVLMLFMAQFLMLGMEQVGTQALVQGSQDFFALVEQSIQVQLLETWNGQLVPYLFLWNQAAFPGMTALPRIVWRAVGGRDVAALTTAWATLTDRGLVQPQEADEQVFRDLLDMPDVEAAREPAVAVPETETPAPDAVAP